MTPDEEIARLRQHLEQATLRAEQATLRAEQATLRAEQAESHTQSTTLTEYLDACHELVFTKLTVETDISRTTKGEKTKPDGKRVPKRMVPWHGFFEEQKTVLGQLYSCYSGDDRVFENANYLKSSGARVARRRIADEKGLELFQKECIEEPVALILEEVCKPGAGTFEEEFPGVRGVVFENHLHPLSDAAEEPTARRLRYLPDHSQNALNTMQLRADQICVFRVGEDEQMLAFVVEYKPPHKLTLHHLRASVREMDIMKDVVNRSTKPDDDDEELFNYNADRMVAAAIVQTYHYMIEGGLEYSYLTTGEAFVFLHIDWKDPKTLYYHLAEPAAEVAAHSATDRGRHCTAVSQVLAFTLLASSTKPHGQAERAKVDEDIERWAEDFASILAEIPLSVRAQSPPSSTYKPCTYSEVNRSPYFLRKNGNPMRGRTSCDTPAVKPDPEDFDDDEDVDNSPIRRNRHPRKPPTQSTIHSEKDDKKGERGNSNWNRGRNYCTQRCLLGLARNQRMDEACPNISSHRKSHTAPNHPVDHETWLRLLHQQLNSNLDDDVKPLQQYTGARGVVFRITMSLYGYTFVAKGTVPVFVEDLEHETAVYQQRLTRLQGLYVPVFLGTVTLSHPYYYDFGVRIGHLICLSWGGQDVYHHGPNSSVPLEQQRLQKDMLCRQLAKALRAIHRVGVLQADVRTPNTLWNEEVRRVFVIDFERARVVHHKGSRIVGKKKKRRWAVGDVKAMRSELKAAKLLFKPIY